MPEYFPDRHLKKKCSSEPVHTGSDSPREFKTSPEESARTEPSSGWGPEPSRAETSALVTCTATHPTDPAGKAGTSFTLNRDTAESRLLPYS